MDKMNTNAKKKMEIIENFVVFVFIFLFCFSIIFSNSIGDLDELWNYNFARNVADGLVPYKDFNMVQTPLLPFICAIFLKVIGNKLLVMRILAVIMQTVIYYLAYYFLRKYSKDVPLSVFSVIALMTICKDIFTIDYNYAVMLVGLIAMIIELNHFKAKEEQFDIGFKYNFLLGILLGLAILFKHTTGIILCIGALGYKVFEVRSKENIKSFFKMLGIRLLGIMVPILVFILYLLITKSFGSFIDYAILGVKHFTNTISYKSLFDIKIVKMFAILVPIVIVCLFIIQFIKDLKWVNILFGYSLATFACTFPISDKIHFMIGSFISIISGILLLILMINYFITTDKIKKIKLTILTFFAIFLVLTTGYKSIQVINKDFIMKEKETELNHLEGIIRNDGLRGRIKYIDEYILSKEAEGKKVLILDAEACIYYIPLNRYNKNYDMFLIGNLGNNGEDKLIEEIKSSENTLFLIKEDNVNWQTPHKVRNYVIKNRTLVDKKSIFYVYE